VLTLVGRARRRIFHNELFSQGANAAIAVLLFLILLLLLGTGVLDARWTVPVSILAVGAALYRARKRLPSFYRAARMVDHRLALADTISTAVYFRQAAPPNVSPAVCQFQRERADRLAETVDVRQAVPYSMPRSVYPLAALILAAGSLFALRYGLTGRLDLQPPLARMLQQQFGGNSRAKTARNIRRQPPLVRGAQDDEGASADDANQFRQPGANSSDAAEALSAADAEKTAASKTDAGKDGNRASPPGDGDQDAQAESDPSQAGENPGQGAAKQDAKQQTAGKLSASNPGQSSSLVDKARDLLQNLLSSLKPPQTNGSNPQQNGDSSPQGKGQPKQPNDKNGQPRKDGQTGDSKEGRQGEQGQTEQDPQDGGNGKNDAQQDNKKPGSGAGSQEGDKRLKDAEDQAAMGRITEILGKRSTNLTGEATVEVESTSQQLRTPYAPRAAQHGQTGGEVNRDEIPVAMQPYVEQYFEQVRKQAPPAKKP
jgi:hypothetical protein